MRFGFCFSIRLFSSTMDFYTFDIDVALPLYSYVTLNFAN